MQVLLTIEDEGQNEEPILGCFGWRDGIWFVCSNFQGNEFWKIGLKLRKISTEKNDFVGDDRS